MKAVTAFAVVALAALSSVASARYGADVRCVACAQAGTLNLTIVGEQQPGYGTSSLALPS